MKKYIYILATLIMFIGPSAICLLFAAEQSSTTHVPNPYTTMNNDQANIVGAVTAICGVIGIIARAIEKSQARKRARRERANQ